MCNHFPPYEKPTLLKEVNVTTTAGTEARIMNNAVTSLLRMAAELDTIRAATPHKKLTRIQKLKRWIDFQVTRIRETANFFREY